MGGPLLGFTSSCGLGLGPLSQYPNLRGHLREELPYLLWVVAPPRLGKPSPRDLVS
jgi:hypothetical protein